MCGIVNFGLVSKKSVVTDAIWAHVQPFFPKHGPQDEAGQRLFFEAVVHVCLQGLTWRGLPERFGNWNSQFQRFNRYAAKGWWDKVFNSLTDKMIAELQIDSTAAKLHRHGSGAAKKGGHKPLGAAVGD